MHTSKEPLNSYCQKTGEEEKKQNVFSSPLVLSPQEVISGKGRDLQHSPYPTEALFNTVEASEIFCQIP